MCLFLKVKTLNFRDLDPRKNWDGSETLVKIQILYTVKLFLFGMVGVGGGDRSDRIEVPLHNAATKWKKINFNLGLFQSFSCILYVNWYQVTKFTVTFTSLWHI